MTNIYQCFSCWFCCGDICKHRESIYCGMNYRDIIIALGEKYCSLYKKEYKEV